MKLPDGAVYHLTAGDGEAVDVVLASQAQAQAAQLRAQLDGAVQELAAQASRASTAARYLLAAVRNICGLVMTTTESEDVKNAVLYAEQQASDTTKLVPTTATSFFRVSQVAPALSAKTLAGMEHLLHLEKATKFETPQWDEATGKATATGAEPTWCEASTQQLLAILASLKEAAHASAQPLPKWHPKVVDGELVADGDAPSQPKS